MEQQNTFETEAPMRLCDTLQSAHATSTLVLGWVPHGSEVDGDARVGVG